MYSEEACPFCLDIYLPCSLPFRVHSESAQSPVHSGPRSPRSVVPLRCSEDSRCKVHNLDLLDNALQAFDELKMSRVLVDIVIPVLFARKLGDEDVRDAALDPC